MAKKTDGISTITSGRIPNGSYARLEAMARKASGNNISRLARIALLEFINRYADLDANTLARLEAKYENEK